MNSVSKNIKKIRLQRKLTQEAMADKLFVTRQTVSNWETGKSQPDIDTLVKIADALNTDTTALIYGLPDSEAQKKEKKHLVFAGGILLILGIFLYFLTPIAAEMQRNYFITQPMMLLRLYFLPILWLVLGWTIMEGFGVLGVVKPTKSKYSRGIHIAAMVVVLLYAALMLPFFIESIISLIQLLQYRQNPSLYPNGFQYEYIFPSVLYGMEQSIINTVYKQPILFVVPSIIFWLSRPEKQERCHATLHDRHDM